MSYRRRVFNHNRRFEPRSRARLLAVAAVVAVVAGVGVAMLIPNFRSVFGASNVANVAAGCAIAITGYSFLKWYLWFKTFSQ